MKFLPTPIEGAWVIEPAALDDHRGLFARTWDAAAFRERGLASRIEQCSISFNTRRGTLRGLHYQSAPHEETKLVRCTSGALWDVIVDLRTGAWFGVELTALNRTMLYIPAGVAHGFQTLTDATEVYYQISERYHSELSRTIRWNDPALGIDWPLPDPILSSNDQNAPLWSR